MTESIHLPALLHAPNQSETVAVQEWFADLNSLTPIQGEVTVAHNGNFLQVDGRGETIVTLTCDRCLQQYNHRLVAEASELIWLQDTATELEEGTACLEETDLFESLPPEGYFQPDDWIYQQLCLALPQRQLCDANCAGISIEHRSTTLQDDRWSKLAELRHQLGNESS
jgi:uncharacterized protein